MKSSDIRNLWINYFQRQGHFLIPSKSLIPQNDPSLLWINSGVATLKDYFSGKKVPPAKRLVNSQKAIRTNDIENVGVTARHHTFFEMLGNFSIGDYFKKEAIAFAIDFLLNDLKMPLEKLYFTYYYEDLETKELWMSHGVSEDHLIPGTKDTNFWEVGSGPCGPNTEIFYDRGQKYDSRGIELLQQDLENDRYIEIWNIVFSTYNSDGEGNYSELKQKNIDTGAGLERIVSIMQDAPTNFDTDLFLPIIHEIEKFTEFRYDINNYFTKNPEQTLINTYFKVIVDHMRTVVNAINDGAKPSNVGRGYILRRLIRRSVHKGMQLKVNEELFLHKLVKVISDTLPFDFDVQRIAKVILDEEVAFSKTIESGRKLLEEYLSSDTKIFPGDVAFKLFETYGFPIELTEEILAEKNITVDMESFQEAKTQHSEASRGAKKAGMDKVINSLALIKGKIDQFVGYDFEEYTSKVLKLLDSENEISENDGISYVILEETPFYATSGGQKHDEGFMLQNGSKIKILNVFKDKFGNHIHKVEGAINNYDSIECFVDKQNRLGLKRNHSGTHLLFCALRTILGPQIVQLGSDNNAARLTFDFPADIKPSAEEIKQIENLVKEYISKDVQRQYLVMTTDQAKEMGAIMTLEEGEYMDPKKVRIVNFEGITADLCGGTHLENSGMLENFKIVSVEKKAAGVFRIKAISSNAIINEYLEEEKAQLSELVAKAIEKNQTLNPQYRVEIKQENNLEDRVSYLKELLEQIKEDTKKLIKTQNENLEINYEQLQSVNIQGNLVYLVQVPVNQIKVLASTVREKYPDALVLAFDKESKMLVVASKAFNSNAIAQQLFKAFDGRGGGNNIMSMGKVNQIINQDLLVEKLEKISWENWV